MEHRCPCDDVLKEGELDASQEFPRTGCCFVSTLICTCRSELRHPSQLSICADTASSLPGAPAPWETHRPGFQQALSFFRPTFPLHLFPPCFFRTGLKRSPSASLFPTWISCEQLLRPSAPCSGNSWKMFILVALAASSRRESG